MAAIDVGHLCDLLDMDRRVGGCDRDRTAERGIGRASIAVGTTTDSYELQFPSDLSGVVDMVALGNIGGRTLTHLVFAVAEPGTRPERDASGVRYTGARSCRYRRGCGLGAPRSRSATAWASFFRATPCGLTARPGDSR